MSLKESTRLSTVQEEKFKYLEQTKRPVSPPQPNEEPAKYINKPLNPINEKMLKAEKKKIPKNITSQFNLREDTIIGLREEDPEIFNPPQINLQKKEEQVMNSNEEKQVVINNEEIMGSFERDEDDFILIKENKEGMLVDLKGRRVNKFGYLIDNEGNIIKRNGELVLLKGDFDKEAIEDAESAFKSKNLIKGTTRERIEETIPIENIKDIEAKELSVRKEELLETRKSVSLDSLMGDTPSNYNVQNQRFNKTREKLQKRKRHDTLNTTHKQLKTPTENETRTTKIHEREYRRNYNKSSQKKKNEKLFTNVDKKRKYSSEQRNALEQQVKNSEELTPRSSTNEARKELTEEETKKYRNEKLQKIFLGSEHEDVISISSVAASKVPNMNKTDRMKDLGNIHSKKSNKSKKGKKRVMKKKRKETLEKDEIDLLITENYNEMKKEFEESRNSKIQ